MANLGVHKPLHHCPGGWVCAGCGFSPWCGHGWESLADLSALAGNPTGLLQNQLVSGNLCHHNTDKPHPCLSTALSRTPGFYLQIKIKYFKIQFGLFSDAGKPLTYQWVGVSSPGPDMDIGNAPWQKEWPHFNRLFPLSFKLNWDPIVSAAVAWNNVCLGKPGDGWLKKRKISFRYFIIQKTWSPMSFFQAH